MGTNPSSAAADKNIKHVQLNNHKARRIHTCRIINDEKDGAIIITVAHYSDGGPAMMGFGNKSEGEIVIWSLQQFKSIHLCTIPVQIEKIQCCDIHKSGKYIAISSGSAEMLIYKISNFRPAQIQNYTLSRIHVANVYTMQKLQFFAHCRPKWILANDQIIDYETKQSVNSWNSHFYSFGFDVCQSTNDWILMNEQNIYVLKSRLNAINSVNAAMVDLNEANDSFYSISQDLITRSSMQKCSNKKNAIIRCNENGRLFAMCHFDKIFFFEICDDEKRINLMHSHQIKKDKMSNKEITFLQWLDECTLIYCVRSVVKQKLQYSLFWFRDLKNDSMRQRILNDHLMDICDLSKVILSMVGFEESEPMQTKINQRVSNISVISLKSSVNEKSVKRASNAVVISCCGAPNAYADQVLDCMIIHPVNASTQI